MELTQNEFDFFKEDFHYNFLLAWFSGDMDNTGFDDFIEHSDEMLEQLYCEVVFMRKRERSVMRR